MLILGAVRDEIVLWARGAYRLLIGRYIGESPNLFLYKKPPPLEPVSVAADLRISNSKKLVEAQNSFVDNSFIASASFREA